MFQLSEEGVAFDVSLNLGSWISVCTGGFISTWGVIKMIAIGMFFYHFDLNKLVEDIVT